MSCDRKIKLLTDHDISIILNGCGWVVQQEDIQVLSRDNNTLSLVAIIENEKVFLKIGKDIYAIYKNLKTFYREYPNLSCKPLDFVNYGVYQVILQEYFDGQPLSEITNKEVISNVIQKIRSIFENKITKSSRIKQQKEFNDIIDEICNLPFFLNTDRQILDNYIRKILLENLHQIEPSNRYSTRDLISRNILLSDNDIRIIDLEFLKKTHFFGEDWVRLYRFGDSQIKNTLLIENYYKQEPWVIHCISYLDQILKDNSKKTIDSVKNFIISDFYEVVFIINKNFQLGNSFLLNGLYKKVDDYTQYKIFQKISNEDIPFKLNQKDNQIEVLNDKVLRMRNSFSWKVTSPVRYIRRIFENFNYFSKKYFIKRKQDFYWYLKNYSDLYSEYKENFHGLKKHYFKYGIKENRSIDNIYFQSDNKVINYKNWSKCFDNYDKLRLEYYNYLIRKKIFNHQVTIIITTYNPIFKFLKKSIDSVFNQYYKNWKLIIVNDGCRDKKVINYLDTVTDNDDRICLITNLVNKNISTSLNSALKLCNSEFYVVLDHDDFLTPNAIYHVVEAINLHPKARIIYSDEDKINSSGRRLSPFFKPAWNPELLLSQNYICHLCALHTKTVKSLGGYCEQVNGAQDWDILLKMVEILNDNQIIHIPRILYHWRIHKNSTSLNIDSKPFAISAAHLSLTNTINRRKIKADVFVSDKLNNHFTIKYKLNSSPLVSIIILTKDKYAYLKRCIDSILALTEYPNYEILIVDHNTTNDDAINLITSYQKLTNISVIREKGEFNFSELNNKAVKFTNGELVLFLNNDTEIINKNWLSELLYHGLRFDVGCVGAKLLYQDRRIQHGGVILGLGGVAGHAFKFYEGVSGKCNTRLNAVQDYSAVTGACLLVRKTLFKKLGGFNTKNLKVAFNDIDFCIRLKKLNYRVLWTPNALLYHHESVSRGNDYDSKNAKRFNDECNYMKRKWKTNDLVDPFYNPNLSPFHEDYRIHPPKNELSLLPRTNKL